MLAKGDPTSLRSRAGGSLRPAAQKTAARTRPETITPETRVFRLGHKIVELTHLDRLYYPQPGYTKADILDYYLAVAPYLLPHLRGRPLTLERWPEGVEDGSFIQKDASAHFPAWLHTFPVERKDGRKIIHYPLVEDEADLLYLVNQGTLTFHSQMSRIDDLYHPDFMLLDVDPPDSPPQPDSPSEENEVPESSLGQPEETGFRQAVEAAFLLRENLRNTGHDPVVKTSGKRGLHLAFRLEGKLDYDSARAWLRELFLALAKKHPRLLTTEIRKEKRRGRVYLDALRMSFGATVVPPYVARPTTEATVSMSVTWEELEKLQSGRHFTIRTAPQRLLKIGDLWEVLT